MSPVVREWNMNKAAHATPLSDKALGALAGLFGCFRVRRPDGEPGWEWLPKSDFRACEGCGDQYHQSWDPPDYMPGQFRRSDLDGGLCPNCSGAD